MPVYTQAAGAKGNIFCRQIIKILFLIHNVFVFIPFSSINDETLGHVFVLYTVGEC